MRIKLLILICFILIFNSCTQTDSEDGYLKAINFHEKYSKEFFESDLLKFNYEPRTQYDLVVNDSTFERDFFRLIIKDNEELYVINPHNFIKMFNLPVDSNYFYDDASVKYENTEFVIEIDDFESKHYQYSDSTIKKTNRSNVKYIIPTAIIENNPIEYFIHLDKLRMKFGIFSYKKIWK